MMTDRPCSLQIRSLVRRISWYYNETQSKRQIVEDVLLKPWTQYCLRHWMGGNGKPGSPEQRVKRFLDGCAYLLLRDNPEGTLTDYKEIMRGRSEIDVSSCPSWIEDKMNAGGHTLCEAAREEQARFQALLDRLDGKAQPYMAHREKKRRGKPETRFHRLERVRREHPQAEIAICAVDTDSCFTACGKWYCIAESAYQYAPRQTSEGPLYDMDRIYVVLEDSFPVLFLDQDANRLNEQDIYP